MKKSSKFACWVALLKSYLPSSFSCQVWQISMCLSCYFYNSLPSGFSKATYICSSLCCILRGCPTSTVYSIKLRTNSQSLLTSSTEQKTMSYPQRPTNWGEKKDHVHQSTMCLSVDHNCLFGMEQKDNQRKNIQCCSNDQRNRDSSVLR